MFPRPVELFSLVWGRLGAIVVIIAVDGLEDDGPARGKDGVVDIQVIGFERETRKDGRDSNGLPIGKMDHTGCHGTELFTIYSTFYEFARE